MNPDEQLAEKLQHIMVERGYKKRSIASVTKKWHLEAIAHYINQNFIPRSEVEGLRHKLGELAVAHSDRVDRTVDKLLEPRGQTDE